MIKADAGKLLLWGLLTLPVTAYGQSDFERGTSAFRDGRYSQALEAFLAAEQSDGSSPVLVYNTALSYYKLGLYHEAALAFERLAQDSEWRDLGQFHRALVAEKQGDLRAARRLYESVARSSSSEKLRRLAGVRLQSLTQHDDAAKRPASGDRFSGVFNVAAGRDDNAFGLQDDMQLDKSKGKDRFQDYFAWAQYYLAGAEHDGWRLHGFGYLRRYDEFRSLNLDAYSLALSRHGEVGHWRTEVGLAFVDTTLNGDELTGQNKLLIRFQRPLEDSWISLAYTPSHNQGNKGFSYLDGWQHLAEARWDIPAEKIDFSVTYQWEANDRDDLAAGEEFFSYSPVRHSLGLSVDWMLMQNLNLGLSAEYRSSAYKGSNRFTDSDGVFKVKGRKADRSRVQLRALWQVSPFVRLATELERTENRENFETYSYDKNELTFSFEYLF